MYANYRQLSQLVQSIWVLVKQRCKIVLKTEVYENYIPRNTKLVVEFLSLLYFPVNMFNITLITSLF